jgi:hypothetical protein
MECLARVLPETRTPVAPSRPRRRDHVTVTRCCGSTLWPREVERPTVIAAESSTGRTAGVSATTCRRWQEVAKPDDLE